MKNGTAALLGLALAIFVFGLTSPGVAGDASKNDVVPRSEVKFIPLNPARGDKSPQSGRLWGDIRTGVPSGMLVVFRNKCKGADIELRLRNVSSAVMEVLTLARLDEVFEIVGGGDDEGDAHSLRHSHGGYEHLHHHHHHHDAAGDETQEDDHDGFDHLPIDLKAVWTTSRSQQAEPPPVFPPAICVAMVIADCRPGECRGVPPPLVGPPDPTRQLRQIRSNVLLV